MRNVVFARILDGSNFDSTEASGVFNTTDEAEAWFAEVRDSLVEITREQEGDEVAGLMCLRLEVEETDLHLVERCFRYARQLNALELPPNGDDFNNLMDMLDGGEYRLPHTDGR